MRAEKHFQEGSERPLIKISPAKAIAESRHKWGLSRYMDPCPSQALYDYSNGFIELQIRASFDISHERISLDKPPWVGEMIWNGGGSRPRENEVLLRFNLAYPLEPQFREALQKAKEVQDERVHKGRLKVINPRRHQANWITYLRVLDAVQAGAPFKEIHEAMYPQQKHAPQYPDTCPTCDKLKKTFQQAHDLVQRKYRNLIFVR